MSEALTPCPHLQAGAWPLTIELVLDEHLAPTDFLATCGECGRCYLLEMLDWQGPHRVMRLSELASAHARRLIHDLSRGSCDPSRAGAEIHQVTSAARRLRWLALLDTRGPRIDAIVPAPDDRTIPTAGWRELPCDGSWVGYARSYVEMEKG